VVRCVLAVLVVGCSFRHGVSHDGSQIVDTPVDIAIDVPIDAAVPCMTRWLNHTVRFTTPMRMDDVDTTSMERDPFLSDDELTMYLSSSRSGGTLLFSATRAAIGDTFSTPAQVTELDTSGGVGKFSMTHDGLTAVFASTRTGGAGGADVWVTTRSSNPGTWGTPSETDASSVDTAGDEQDAEIDSSGVALYYAHNVVPTPQALMVATRGSVTAAFGTPAAISELNSGTGEADPTVAFGDRVIVFSSSRTGTGVPAGVNLWYATRASSSGTWGTPELVPDVNAGANEGDAHLGGDGCRLYFASDVNTDYDIFVASMR
jgi:hypothetical protein